MTQQRHVVPTERPPRHGQQPGRRLGRDQGDHPVHLGIGRPERPEHVGVGLRDQAADVGLAAVELAQALGRGGSVLGEGHQPEVAEHAVAAGEREQAIGSKHGALRRSLPVGQAAERTTRWRGPRPRGRGPRSSGWERDCVVRRAVSSLGFAAMPAAEQPNRRPFGAASPAQSPRRLLRVGSARRAP